MIRTKGNGIIGAICMIYILCQGISKAAIIEKPAAGQEEAKQADEIPAAEAAAAPPVMDLSPEELLEMSKLVIADPKEGALVGPNPIIFINLMTPNPEQFNEEFGEASVCLQLNDDVHHACWPITHARMKLAELPEGTHKVTASILHPETRRLVRQTTSELRTFTSQPDPSTASDGGPVMTKATDIPMEDLPQLDAPEDVNITAGGEAAEPVVIDMPLLVVTQPKELSAVQSSFKAIADVHVTNTTIFSLLFMNEFVCLSLDDQPSACWPISQEADSQPFFLGVEDGLHTIVAALTHPYSGAIIPETKSKRRTFFALASEDEEEEVTNVALPKPSKKASTAASASSSSSSTDEATAVPVKTTTSTTTTGSSSSSGGIGGGESRFKALKMEAAVMLQVDVDGTPQTLSFTRSTNSTMVAQEFCAKHGLLDEECVGAIDELIIQSSSSSSSTTSV